ncbi:MAG: molybdate ABC transporter substrate-binding protein [Acidobacteriota bacterium]|nr:molybdate ABC transporter substrate-binding protein [Acidobacteriota bacterium]
MSRLCWGSGDSASPVMHKLVILLAVLLSSCNAPQDSPATLHVAAASNLARLFPALARSCQRATGLTLVPSFGATAMLSQQIENGGPFDLFLAADTEHTAALSKGGHVLPDSVHIYAQGRLVLFAPRRPGIRSLDDLRRTDVRKIAIANPELAPYGRASVEALQALHLWKSVEPKVIYGQNISAVLQFVDSSNVDAAFTALALVKDRAGNIIQVPPQLHRPIDQAFAIPRSSTKLEGARRAAQWMLSAEAQTLFKNAGYGTAPQ